MYGLNVCVTKFMLFCSTLAYDIAPGVATDSMLSGTLNILAISSTAICLDAIICASSGAASVFTNFAPPDSTPTL